jgi:hypothetical protein
MHALDKARYEAAATARTDMRATACIAALSQATKPAQLTYAKRASSMLRFRNGYFARDAGTHFAATGGLAGWPVCRGLTNTTTYYCPDCHEPVVFSCQMPAHLNAKMLSSSTA